MSRNDVNSTRSNTMWRSSINSIFPGIFLRTKLDPTKNVACSSFAARLCQFSNREKDYGGKTNNTNDTNVCLPRSVSALEKLTEDRSRHRNLHRDFSFLSNIALLFLSHPRLTAVTHWITLSRIAQVPDINDRIIVSSSSCLHRIERLNWSHNRTDIADVWWTYWPLR